MTTLKSIFAIGACAVVGLGAAGCGGGDDNGKGSGSKKGGSVVSLTPAAQKLNRVSADVHGLQGSAKGTVKGGAANSFQPGDTLDISALPQAIVQTVKQKTGIDVQVTCPPTVSYSPGSVFYCKLTTPDGTAYDVECTQQEGGGIQWRLVTTQPVPPAPPGPTPPQLKNKSGKSKASPATGAATSLQPGDQLDLSNLDEAIETRVKQQTGLDVNVECPATADYSPGSTFYCKLYTSDGTAYDVLCTLGQDGSISWKVIVDKTAKTAATSRLSSDAKKIVSLSAKDHGLAAQARKPTGANKFSDGEQVDTQFVVDDIVRYFKEQKGLDVRAACPPQVQFALGSIFYCKLYAPDGTGYDVRVTWQQNGAYWEVLTTQPTPPPPPGPTPQKLKGTDGSGKTTGDATPQPGDPISTTALEDQIEATVKQSAGVDVNVQCPDTVNYAPGSKFYCKLFTADGTPYDVEVTQGQNLQVTWKILTPTKQP